MILVTEVVVGHNSAFSSDFPQRTWTNRGTEKRDSDGQQTGGARSTGVSKSMSCCSLSSGKSHLCALKSMFKNPFGFVLAQGS